MIKLAIIIGALLFLAGFALGIWFMNRALSNLRL
jgi:uncharacterized protein YneF (UPF0154 family)